MFDELQKLVNLQAADQKIDALKKELKQWPEAERTATARALAAKQETEFAVASVQEREVTLKRLELDAETRKNTIVRLKTQQYETRKNEEFQALSAEVARYESEVDEIETREIELLESIEEAKELVSERKKEQTLVESEVAGEVEEIQARLREAEQNMEQAKAARAATASRLSEDDLGLYERVARTKGIHTVVPVRHGVCDGCHMKVTQATAMALRHQNALLTCDQCGRFIYLEE